MTPLLLTAMLLGNLGACVTEEVMLAPPAQVRFESLNYKNILHWSPPTWNTSLQYHVQWKIYGESQWLDVDRCQGIQRQHCDLTGVTSDLREWYYARVHAYSAPSSKSAWALSPRFNPRWDTVISPPLLRLNVTAQGIVVSVKSLRVLVRKIPSGLRHKIYVVHPSGAEEVFEIDCCSDKLTLKDLGHKAKYCFQAQTLIPRQAKSSAHSSLKCVTVP